MRAWYVFAALGFYLVEPASGRFTLGRPLVPQARLHLSNEKMLQIMRSISVDGMLRSPAITKPEVDYQSLLAGGTLSFPRLRSHTPQAK